MSQTTNQAAGPPIRIQSSRIWALVKGHFTKLIFPSHLSADRLGISLVKVEFWLTPWKREDEHLPMSHLAEVTHNRGLIWDSIAIESSGGLNPLHVEGLRKGAAQRFVTQVRAWMNV
jgi:hypothetical protein